MDSIIVRQLNMIQARGNAAMVGDRLFIFDDESMIEGHRWRNDPVFVQVIENLPENVSARCMAQERKE